MADKSAIGWTEATWNPTTGCTEISQGCKHCYAKTLSKRLMAMGQHKYRNNFEYTEHKQDLNTPLKWKKPRMIFVNSMSDLFHEKATFDFTSAVFDTMNMANQHVYQILTKRPEKMARFINKWLEYRHLAELPGHIWVGTSIENNATLHRMDPLRTIHADVRFISFEPLLEKLEPVNLEGIQWAIIGGESGPNYRTMQEEWAKDLIVNCRMYSVPIFFKQWGGTRPTSGGRHINGRTYDEFPRVAKVLKA